MLVLVVVVMVISFEMKEKLNSKMSRSSSVGRRKWLKIADAAAAAVAAETESLVCDCQKRVRTPTDIEQDLRPELLNMSKHTQTGEANRKQRKHSPRIPASRVERRILASEDEDISCSRRTR